MSVYEAINEANELLPGKPVLDGEDPRWQAIIRIGEYIESDPEPVWDFIRRWGSHAQEDLRDAIATCLLEHLLERHFTAYFPRLEQVVLPNTNFQDTLKRCWQFGQAGKPGNAKKFKALCEQLQQRDLGEKLSAIKSDDT
jgi:hypothetical protein